jgi:hypothetical protein
VETSDIVQVAIGDISVAGKTSLARVKSASINFDTLMMQEDKRQAIECRKIDGSFGTKLDFILKHLLALKISSSGSTPIKSIMFSQWEQVLGTFPSP